MAKAKNRSVFIVSASWCSPCRVLKKRLDKEGIPYTELDADNLSPAHKRKLAGIQSVPVIIYVGGKTGTRWLRKEVGVGPDTVEDIKHHLQMCECYKPTT